MFFDIALASKTLNRLRAVHRRAPRAAAPSIQLQPANRACPPLSEFDCDRPCSGSRQRGVSGARCPCAHQTPPCLAPRLANVSPNTKCCENRPCASPSAPVLTSPEPRIGLMQRALNDLFIFFDFDIDQMCLGKIFLISVSLVLYQSTIFNAFNPVPEYSLRHIRVGQFLYGYHS